MARTELEVVVLWHMHQPDYRDPRTGRAVMPWVRLHALSSYGDVLRAVRETPDARAVVNVVPILLEQLEGLRNGPEDDYLALTRPDPADLDERQRLTIIRNFFAFNQKRRFAELPRLAELLRKRGRGGPGAEAIDPAAFTDRDLRDLQVGFNLAWSGRTLREHERVRALLGQGRDFSEADKADLLAIQAEYLDGILPAYREAAAGGAVEISCTPLCHPILPLLCDTESALEARPELALPAVRFRRPGDAWYHVRTALDECGRILGVRPAGMWPAEGSVSGEAVRIFAAAGVGWIAGDQDVLEASCDGTVPPGGHFQAHRLEGVPAPALFFRDKGLSDRIGFVYSGWPAERAADDLVGLLGGVRDALPAGRWIVPIILDGENPWEAYPDWGVPFQRALYAKVAAAEGMAWTTFGDWLEREGTPQAPPLPRLKAGSWIRGDFTTWIGHAEKNAAWERLEATRRWLEPRLKEAGALVEVRPAADGEPIAAPDPDRLGPGREEPLARAWQSLAAAEGSDWFWWYGDDNPTDFGLEFDGLFRAHLQHVYEALGAEPDHALQAAIRRAGAPRVRPPRYPLEVDLDGRETHYFEWLDAGVCEVRQGGAMQRDDLPVSRLMYGASPENFLLRLDPPEGGDLSGLAGLTVTVLRLDEAIQGPGLAIGEAPLKPGPLTPTDDRQPAARGHLDRIVEIAVPWSRLGLAPGESCQLFVALTRATRTELVIPAGGALPLRIPVGPEDADDWLV